MFGNFWVSAGLTGIWLIRIVCLKDRSILIWAIVTSLVFGCWFVFQRDQRRLQTLPEMSNTTVKLQVQPDDVLVGPDSVQLKGRLPTGQQVTGQYYAAEGERPAPQWQIKRASTLTVAGDVMQFEPATNVNEFDYGAYQRQNGVLNRVKIAQLLAVTPTTGGHVWQRWLNACHALRARLIIETKKLPPLLALYVQGLFLGYRADNFYDNLAAVTDLGLIHLFSISGFHVVWLTAVMAFVLKRLRCSQAAVNVIILLSLPSYFVLAGAAPSLLRAILVSMLALGASLMHWKVTPLTLWGLSLMLALLWYPALLMQLGGQLSYALAFALIFVEGRSTLMKTVLLNMVSLPFVLYHVYQWHLWSLMANLLILPVFSWLIFPVTLIGGLLGLKFPVVAQLCTHLLGWFTQGLDTIAHFPGMITFGKPHILLVVLLVGLTLVLLTRHRQRTVIIALAVTYAASFLMIHYPVKGEVTFFDIGQGDSFMIREPYGKQITMIDTGGDVFFGGHQVKKRSRALRLNINYMKSMGIHRIDALCLSHQDADHVGFVGDVLKTMAVKRLYIPWGMAANPQFMKRIRPNLNQTQLISVRAGQTIPGTHLKVVHPFTPGLGGNEDSMVLTGQYGGLQFMFTGDLGQDGEKDIIAHYPQLRTDVLKLGHHGSKTSSAPEFIQALRPRVGIISAGRHNRYGHPNQETLATLAQQHVPYFNTQTNGMIRYRFRAHHPGYWETVMKEDAT